MRVLLAKVSMIAFLGGVGCAAAEPLPPRAPAAEPERAPLTAPDEPPPPETRPKLTSSVTIGETAPGVPSAPHSAVGPSANASSSNASSSSRRDLFAEDRASAPRIMGNGYRSYYRYGRHPMQVNNGPSIGVVAPPRGTPGVGGSWPAPTSHGPPAMRSRVH